MTKVQHDLLHRAGGGRRQGDVLDDGVALAQPLRRPRDEGAQLSGALDASYSRIIQYGLARGEDAHEGVGFVGQEAFVAGNGVVGARGPSSCTRRASAMGAEKTSGIQGIGISFG